MEEVFGKDRTVAKESFERLCGVVGIEPKLAGFRSMHRFADKDGQWSGIRRACLVLDETRGTPSAPIAVDDLMRRVGRVAPVDGMASMRLAAWLLEVAK